MNQRQIQEYLQNLGNLLTDRMDQYTGYNQPISDIENSLSALKSTVKEDGTCHNEFLAKACIMNTLNYCVKMLYDLIPFDTGD